MIISCHKGENIIFWNFIDDDVDEIIVRKLFGHKSIKLYYYQKIFKIKMNKSARFGDPYKQTD